MTARLIAGSKLFQTVSIGDTQRDHFAESVTECVKGINNPVFAANPLLDRLASLLSCPLTQV
jgi:hypothetical protein